MTLIAPASDKQVSFVKNLIAEREVSETTELAVLTKIDAGTYTKAEASDDIDVFLRLPKRKKASARDGLRDEMQALLSSVPKSKYAVRSIELDAVETEDEFKNDLVFIELKEFMGTLYVRQLHGSPGGFLRTHLKAETVSAIIQIIKVDPYKYARLFGEHYTCCGSCGAPLTDEKSRELLLGPECRKKFGL